MRKYQRLLRKNIVTVHDNRFRQILEGKGRIKSKRTLVLRI